MPIFTEGLSSVSLAGSPMEFSTNAINECWSIAKQATNAFDDIITGTISRIDDQAAGDTLVIYQANETAVGETVVTIPNSGSMPEEQPANMLMEPVGAIEVTVTFFRLPLPRSIDSSSAIELIKPITPSPSSTAASLS